jgi:hypothetical protein
MRKIRPHTGERAHQLIAEAEKRLETARKQAIRAALAGVSAHKAALERRAPR